MLPPEDRAKLRALIAAATPGDPVGEKAWDELLRVTGMGKYAQNVRGGPPNPPRASIPADLDRDTDCLIGAALRDRNELRAALTRALDALEEALAGWGVNATAVKAADAEVAALRKELASIKLTSCAWCAQRVLVEEPGPNIETVGSEAPVSPPHPFLEGMGMRTNPDGTRAHYPPPAPPRVAVVDPSKDGGGDDSTGVVGTMAEASAKPFRTVEAAYQAQPVPPREPEPAAKACATCEGFGRVCDELGSLGDPTSCPKCRPCPSCGGGAK